MQARSGPSLAERTIADFGEQWTRYPEASGYYASLRLLEDVLSPLIDPADIRGARVGEIGSGQGRIVRMLAAAGAERIVALEPSVAFDVMVRNVEGLGDRVECVRADGSAFPPKELDLIVSIGVIHHIPDPAPTVQAAYRALRRGGRFFVWVYAREGNEAYLRFALPLRRLTTRLPSGAVGAAAWVLVLPATLYAHACRFLPLPLRDYARRVFGRVPWRVRRIIIYDQLKPACAEYYTRERAERLLRDGGFGDVAAYHRHGYSWSIVGTKP